MDTAKQKALEKQANRILGAPKRSWAKRQARKKARKKLKASKKAKSPTQLRKHKDQFYSSWEWKAVRYEALKSLGQNVCFAVLHRRTLGYASIILNRVKNSQRWL